MSLSSVAVLGFSAGSPAPPQLPKAFSVSVSVSYASTFERAQYSAVQATQKKSFYFDNSTADGTLRQRLNASEGFASTAWTLFTPKNDSLRMFALFENDCRPLPLEFSFNQGLDLSWLPRAKFAGAVADGNRFVYLDARSSYNYSLVASADGSRLRYLDSTFTGRLPGTGNATSTIRQTFGDDLKVGAPAPSLFEIPVAGCFEKVAPCAAGAVETMDLYLAHPHQFRYLDNEDTGDARGDVTFLCPDVLQPGSSAFNLYDAVSHYRVEIDTHWAQYQQCNGYPGLCFGLEDFYVGRQIPYGSALVPLSGQCTPNLESGNWFSHTLGGKCAEDQRPGGGVCSWRVVERVKTIDLRCLVEDAGMKASCAADMQAGGVPPVPFTKWIYNRSLPVFLGAFASEDAAKGGCPSV